MPVSGLSLGQQLQYYRRADPRMSNLEHRQLASQPRKSTVDARAGVRPTGKYQALAEGVCEGARPMTLTFAEIDQIVGGLPTSARKHRAWWSNDRTHPQATAWLGCNRKVIAVDLNRGIVTFG